MSVLITLAVTHGYFCQPVVCCVATKEGRAIYNYMRALEARFAPRPNRKQRRKLEAKRQEVSALLDKEGKKKLLRLVDAHTMTQEEIALSSFVAGFRPAWGIAMELGAEGSCSYKREWEEINRQKNHGEGVENDG